MKGDGKRTNKYGKKDYNEEMGIKRKSKELPYEDMLKIFYGTFTKYWADGHLKRINEDHKYQDHVCSLANEVNHLMNDMEISNTVQIDVFIELLTRCIDYCVSECESEECKEIIRKQLGIK